MRPTAFAAPLRQASRAVSRLYDEELRGVGLRTTQYSLLYVVAKAGRIRQGDLSGLTSLDETTLTRNLRLLVNARWLAVRSGGDRREKLITITKAGTAKLAEAGPAWERAQARMRAQLPDETWQPPAGGPPGASQTNGPSLIFLGPIDAYTCFCDRVPVRPCGPRPRARRNGHGRRHAPRGRVFAEGK